MDMLRKAVSTGIAGVLTTLMFVNLAAAQPQPPQQSQQAQQAPAAPARGNQAGGPAAQGGGFGNFDVASIQQMMDDNNRQTLGATPDEWKVLGPRFNKVQTLSRSLNGGVTGMFGMGRGGMGMPGGPGGMGDAITRILGEPTAFDKARDALYTVIDKKPDPAELQNAIKAFRSAKEKIRTEVAAAQADLKKICTPQQEATLMAMGLLD
jgi:hypothetical protein